MLQLSPRFYLFATLFHFKFGFYRMENKRIPVTIITGFLGAGKTTLLNKLINQHADIRFAIIENEFGEIGIDGALIVGARENLFELSNGCICCSLQNGFYETISVLLSAEKPVEHLLVETTGIADPDSVIQAFLTTESMQRSFELDSVICIADAQNLEDLVDVYPEVRKQLALADTVLLNKTDCVSTEYVDALQRSISLINPAATVLQSTYSDGGEMKLLNTFSYRPKAVETGVLAFRELSFMRNAEVGKGSLLQKPDAGSVKHSIRAGGFILPGSFRRDAFLFWVKNFLFFNRNTVFRIKGIVSFWGEDQKLVFQAVRDNFVFENIGSWGDETPFSKLVFIGKNLDSDKLEDNLYDLLYTETDYAEQN